MAEITRETLEMAALAAGYADARYEDWPGMEMRHGYACAIWTGESYINPAEDDGDAARLAVRLQIDAAFGHHITHKVYASRPTAFPSCPVSAAHDGTEPDKLRAWREAVVLCAAAVGERMQKGGA